MANRQPLSIEARSLVASNRRGVLATLLDNDGYPYASLVDYTPLPNGDALMLLSKLAEHQKYLAADSRASLLVSPSMYDDNALALPRVSLVGRVIRHEEREPFVDLYLSHHPEAAQYIGFPDFAFYQLQVEKARYIAGFGRMGWLTEERYKE